MTTGGGAVATAISRRLDLLRADVIRSRVDYEQILVHLSGLSGSVKDPATRKAMELVASVVAMDYELKVLLIKVLAEPEDREVWEKYVALLCWATIEELPRQIGADYRDAARDFKEALKSVRVDADFVQSLADIRNKIVAHRDLDNGDHWPAQWHLTSIANKHNGTSVLGSKIVVHSAAVLDALGVLGRALLSMHPNLRP